MKVRSWLAAGLASVLGIALMTVSTVPAQADPAAVWGAPVIITDAPTTVAVLNAVDCPVAGECTAVGTDTNPAVWITTFVGGVKNSVTPAGGSGSVTARGISCVAGFNCIAVGRDQNAKPMVLDIAAGVAPTPEQVFPSNGTDGKGELLDISCITLDDCVAVGNDIDGSPIYLVKSSGTWGAVQQLANVPGTTGSLNSVTCLSSIDCFAVGVDGNQKPMYVIMTFGSWGTPVELTTSGWLGTLNSISCTTTINCVAVGQHTDNTTPMVVSMANGVWGDLTELATTAGGGTLWSVDCAATGECQAVGQDSGNFAIYASMIGGVWTATTVMPTPLPAETGEWFGVSCSRTTECLAVGKELDSDQAMYVSTIIPITVVVYGAPGSMRPNITGGGTLGADPAVRMGGYTGLEPVNGVTITLTPDCPALGDPTNSEATASSPDGTYLAPRPTCSEGTPNSFSVTIAVAPTSCLAAVGLPDGTYVVGSTQITLAAPFGTEIPDGSGIEAYLATNGDTPHTFTMGASVGVYLPAVRACAPSAPGSTATTTTAGGFDASSTAPWSNGGSPNLTVADNLLVTGFNRLLAKPLVGGSSQVYGGYSNVYSRCAQNNDVLTPLTCQLGPPGGVRVSTGGVNGRWDPSACAGQQVNLRSRVMTQMGYGLWSDAATITMSGPCS